MVRLPVKSLPKHVQDIIELRESVDGTFSRFSDDSYDDIFYDIVQQRRRDKEHHLMLSIHGMTGCLAEGTLITTQKGLKPIEDIVNTDKVWAGGKWSFCSLVKKGVQRVKLVRLGNGTVMRMTGDHRMKTVGGWKTGGELGVGDVLIAGSVGWRADWDEQSERAAVVAMLLADGHVDCLRAVQKYDYVRKTKRVLKKTPKKENSWLKKRVRFFKGDESLRRFMQRMLRKHFGARSIGEYVDRNIKVVCVQNEEVFNAVVGAGVPIGEKSGIVEIPEWVLQSDAAMNGFLAGYFACDGSYYAGTIEVCSVSEKVIRQMHVWMQSRGVIGSVIHVVSKDARHKDKWRLLVRQWDSLNKWVECVPNLSDYKKAVVRKKDDVAWVKYNDETIGKWRLMKKKGMTYQKIADEEGVEFAVLWRAMNKKSRGVKRPRYTGMKEHLLRVIEVGDGGDKEVFDIQVNGMAEYIANGVVSHNSGKSLSALTIAALLDPGFSVDRVFFSYQELVYARASLPDNCCVIVDEQAATYGVDSHRIMVILATLKEQLRKRGISFIFCSPVLYSESESSHYIIETVYIDEEEQEVVAALKSPEKLVYGHIHIPHPLKPIDEQGSLLTKEFLDAYQAKKDKHLEEVLGRRSMDPTEEHAAQVVKNPIFKKAERIYVARYGYIPQGSLQQLIGKIFPEFAGGVMAGEVAGRVRLNKETAGQWTLPGGSAKRRQKNAII